MGIPNSIRHILAVSNSNRVPIIMSSNIIWQACGNRNKVWIQYIDLDIVKLSFCSQIFNRLQHNFIFRHAILKCLGLFYLIFQCDVFNITNQGVKTFHNIFSYNTKIFVTFNTPRHCLGMIY